ncbi:MAG: hypothetical protein KKB70_08345 [Proteobacteria bacterium]|nr:hypothetical protein [Pseudomonadota bacterium]
MHLVETIERVSFPGLGGCDSFSGPVEIYKMARNQRVVIVSEISDNPGTSICNGITMFATTLLEKAWYLDEEATFFVVHYGPESYSNGRRASEYSWARLRPGGDYYDQGALFGPQNIPLFSLPTRDAWRYLGMNKKDALGLMEIEILGLMSCPA